MRPTATHEPAQPLAEMVRAHRRQLGMTQESLAAKSGLSVRSIRKLETGRITVPRPATIHLLADAFGLSGADREVFYQIAATGASDGAHGPTAPAQLPADLTGFTAREDELDRLDALLASAAASTGMLVIVISGTAGVGKTTLAVHWAHRIADRFPAGNLYVDLRGYGPNGTSVAAAEAVRDFLDALQVPQHRIPANPQGQVALYRSQLAGRRMLVVLDNARTAEQVRPLLPGGSGCLVLITSRNQLSSLAVAPGAQLLSLDMLSSAEAYTLLAGRLSEERLAVEPEATTKIIQHCAGLPLALAITAARAAARPSFPLAALVTALRETAGGLDEFTGEDPAVDLRATFGWSYHALSVGAARLFRLLGLHPGPDFGVGVVASLAGVPTRQVQKLLAELAAASLIVESLPGRYLMHDLLRAFAAELAASDAHPRPRSAQRRLLDYYLHTAYAGSQQLIPFDLVAPDSPEPASAPEQFADSEQAMAWFTTEHRVLRSAVGLAARTGLVTRSWQLAWFMASFHAYRGLWREQVATSEIALPAVVRAQDLVGQAYLHRMLGRAHMMLNCDEPASHHQLAALRLFQKLDNQSGQALARSDLAGSAIRQRRHRDALDHTQHELSHHRAAGNLIGEAASLNNLGLIHALLGEPELALRSAERALTLHQKLGDRYGEACAWDTMGTAHQSIGKHQQAVDCHHTSLRLVRAIGSRFPEAEVLTHLGDAYHALGDHRAARASWRRAAAILDDLGHPDAAGVHAKLKHGSGM